jgi:hypothetical protein
MNTGIDSVWLLAILSTAMIVLSKAGKLKQWPKVPLVALLSNISVIIIYNSFSYGQVYYLINIIKIAPLILLLCHFAGKDPAPNWSYRAMCLVFILQIAIHGIHVLTDLNFTYYGQAYFIASAFEFAVILLGGFNVRLSFVDKNNNNTGGAKDRSIWARQNIKARR